MYKSFAPSSLFQFTSSPPGLSYFTEAGHNSPQFADFGHLSLSVAEDRRHSLPFLIQGSMF